MKINWPLYCLLLFFLFSSTLQARSIKITTWNIGWMSSLSDVQNHPVPQDIKIRSPQDFTRLAYYAKKLNSDLIALQETGSITTAKLIIPADQYDFFISQDNISQHPILAVRKTASYHVRQNHDITALSQVSRFHPLRSGVDVTLYNDKTSIRILVIHLKAKCPDQPLTNPKPACVLLRRQHPILNQWIQDRIKEKQAFIILGDFNRILSIHDIFFKTLPTPIIIPTTGLASPCWGGNYFIDGFITDPLTNKRMIDHSLKVMVYQEKQYEFQERLSDHCPVSIQLALP